MVSCVTYFSFIFPNLYRPINYKKFSDCTILIVTVHDLLFFIIICKEEAILSVGMMIKLSKNLNKRNKS
jgi:hypothetical protein